MTVTAQTRTQTPAAAAAYEEGWNSARKNLNYTARLRLVVARTGVGPEDIAAFTAGWSDQAADRTYGHTAPTGTGGQ